MKTYLLITLSAVLFMGCNSSNEEVKTNDIPDNQNQVVQNTSDIPKFNIEVPTNDFIFSDEKDQVLTTEKNSRIYISKNSFADQNGEDVKGEVKVVFKEYHSTGEIIASKIPMVFENEKGETGNFESAGMFEITAYQDGNDLILKEGKTIRVDLNSEETGTYNFYNYSDNDLAWVEKDTDCKPVRNPVKTRLAKEKDSIANLPKISPKKPIEYKKGDALFDINIDYTKHILLKDLNGVMWKITDTSETNVKIANQQLFNKKYAFLRLEPLENEYMEYDLFFTHNKEVLAIRAVPVMQGKLLSQQREKYAELINRIEKNIKRENEIQDQLKRENDLLRTFNVDKLGVYNYDRLYKLPDYIAIQANFIFEGGEDAVTDDVCVYLIPANKKVVIKYTVNTFSQFSINPKGTNKLIAVLPNNDVYYLSNTDIKKLKLQQFEGQSKDIVLKKYKAVDKANQLDELIAKI